MMGLKNLTRISFAITLLFLASSTASADIISIDFDDGTPNSILTDQYAGLGITFENTQYTDELARSGMSLPLGIIGMGDIKYLFGIDEAIVANFSVDVVSVSIVGIDVGVAGARIEAYNSSNELLGSDTAIGTTTYGTGEYYTLEAAGNYISRIVLYQPYDQPEFLSDGMFFDNLSFETAAVPEPSLLVLLFIGIGAVCGAGFRFLK